MKSWVRLLLCPLYVTVVFAGPNRDVVAGSWTNDHTELASPMMLAGSNGHDTVGGLMPPARLPAFSRVVGLRVGHEGQIERFLSWYREHDIKPRFEMIRDTTVRTWDGK
jgi:hypothetical protein